MILTKYINTACILPEMNAKNKADALKELTHVLFEKKKMHDSMGPAMDQIMARESTESTGIGRGIAVPHARVPGMKQMACAVGRIPHGLDFMAVDRTPVHLIFLICYPPSEQTAYLNFIATVAKLLSNQNHLNDMLQAEDAESMFSILERISTAFSQVEGEPGDESIPAEPGIEETPDAHADLILLARLQLCQEMLDNAKTGKAQIRKRMESIRSMVQPRLLAHYDKLMKAQAPALVPVEGDTCQGCYMRLPSKFVQQIRQDSDHIHTCSSCRRYIYVV